METVSRVVETVESNLQHMYAAIMLNYNKANECVRLCFKTQHFFLKIINLNS